MKAFNGARVADEFVTEFGEGEPAEALMTALRRAGGEPASIFCRGDDPGSHHVRWTHPRV